MKRAALKMH